MGLRRLWRLRILWELRRLWRLRILWELRRLWRPSRMNNRLRSSVSVNVSIFGVGHALIDAACAVVIFSLPGMKALSPDVLFAIIILYNGLAFAMQAPLGFLADFIRKPELTAVVG